MNVQERVARGVALLDKKVPGWVDRINLATLDVGLSDRCILGQVFGGYSLGLSKLQLTLGAHLGFVASSPTGAMSVYDFLLTIAYEFAALTEEWRRVITILRQRVEQKEMVLV